MANNPTLYQRQVGLGAWDTDAARSHIQDGHVRIPIVPRGMGAPVKMTLHRGVGARGKGRAGSRGGSTPSRPRGKCISSGLAWCKKQWMASKLSAHDLAECQGSMITGCLFPHGPTAPGPRIGVGRRRSRSRSRSRSLSAGRSTPIDAGDCEQFAYVKGIWVCTKHTGPGPGSGDPQLPVQYEDTSRP